MAKTPAAANGVVNLEDKFSKFTKTFTPHIVAEVNDFYVLLAKLVYVLADAVADAEEVARLVAKASQ